MPKEKCVTYKCNFKLPQNKRYYEKCGNYCTQCCSNAARRAEIITKKPTQETIGLYQLMFRLATKTPLIKTQ